MKKLSIIFALVFMLVAVSGPVKHTQAYNTPDLTAGIGVWDCWDDGTIDPCHNSLNSVYMNSITDGWAVGEKGTIMRWNGAKWSMVNSPTKVNLNAVQMITTTEGWTVGEDGTILNWNGTTWSQVSSPTSYDLVSISIISSTNVWIAGWGIFHWDGISWNLVSTPNNRNKAIAMTPGTNGTDGWAVGTVGSILRWNGNQWNEFTSPTDKFLMDIVMISATDGWIVGDDGTFLHWDGSTWSPVSAPASSISTIWEIDAASSTDAWAIGFDNGSNNIYHWNGTNWGWADGNVDNIAYSGIAVTPNTNGNDAWVVGGSGYILRWNGVTWTSINEPYTRGLYDVQMLSNTDGWTVGTGFPVARGDAFHWDGTDWLPIKSMDAFSVDFITSTTNTTGWAVGVFGDINRWDGSSWSSDSSPVTVDLYSVDILSADDAWAVGGGWDTQTHQRHGAIIHLDNSTWITVTSPTTKMLYGVSMTSPTSGWAVGEDGTILEWNGSVWQTYTSPTTIDLSSIKMLSASNGWIVGGSGIILHWDGMLWASYSSPTSSYLNDVDFISPTDGWAVGGTILHWDGVNWTQVDVPANPGLNAIAFSTAYELWAVGYSGVILHYEFTPSLAINYSTGAPGSFLNIAGAKFPPNDMTGLTINGHSIGEIATDSSGSFTLTLTTSQADEGFYYLNASVNPSATVKFILDNGSEIRPQDGSFTTYAVPAGIAFTHEVYMPLVNR